MQSKTWSVIRDEAPCLEIRFRLTYELIIVLSQSRYVYRA